jgi:hypothetical protein
MPSILSVCDTVIPTETCVPMPSIAAIF